MPTVPSTAEFKATLATFQDLRRDPLPQHWQTKWSCAAEAFWDGLSQSAAESHHLQIFISLLEDADRFMLARLVIPDLRRADLPALLNEQQQQVLKQTQDMRTTIADREAMRQEDFDTEEYSDEKRVQRDSDMHRTRVLIHDSEAYGSVDEKEIQRWLELAPKPGRPSGHGDGS